MGSKEKKLTQDSLAIRPKWYGSSNNFILLFILIVATYFTYSPGFSPEKEFTNWDDLGYVVNQPLIQTQDADSAALLWKPSTEVMLNYHPITMWTLAKNYEAASLDIQPYFQTNLFLHVANALLVFFLLFNLANGSIFVSFFGALLFAIHPMHVESVAWISERKDVLYTFFFLWALLAYLRYQGTQKITWLLISFALFLLSCFSKAMAVPLPFVLLLLDYYVGRKINWKSILEKIPFIAVAIWFGLNALAIQSKGAITDFDFFTSWQRIIFASYGFLSYWVKFFVPVGLSAFYPYPNLDKLNEMPIYFTLAPFALFIIIVGILFLSWKKGLETFKISLFGIGFFGLMVALVLQFISVGAAITADRYSYIPYIGLSLMILLLLEKWTLFQKIKKGVVVSLVLFCAALMFSSFERTKVWTNSGTLWTDVIEKHPFVLEENGKKVDVVQTGAEVAYKNRGNYYREHGDSSAAMKDYMVLVKARVKDPLIYSNVGNMYALMNQFDSSLQMYTMALERNPKAFDVYMNRGITYVKMLDYKHATADFNAALNIKKDDVNTLVNLCAAYLNGKMFDDCIRTCKKLEKVNPNRWESYFYLGTAYVNQGKYSLGASSLEKAISMNPNDPYAWYNAGIAQQQIGNKEKAKSYILKAKSLNYPVTDAILNSL
ncbi:MAG: tetratricopeptide repeat protein [Flavobacteriales bacterium]